MSQLTLFYVEVVEVTVLYLSSQYGVDGYMALEAAPPCYPAPQFFCYSLKEAQPRQMSSGFVRAPSWNEKKQTFSGLGFRL